MVNRLHTVPDRAPEARTELLTFLIADVRGYTRFTEQRGDEDAAALAAKFAGMVRKVVEARDGQLLELRGDEALSTFRSPRQAIRAAAELQDRLALERDRGPDLPVAVGVGLDTGEAVQVEGGYRGGAINLASRLCAAAAPGEILASHAVVHLARKVTGLEYRDRGSMRLKGLEEPVQVFQVVDDHGENLDDAQATYQDQAPQAAHRETAVPEQHLPSGGFLGSLPEGQLVGRSEEVRRLLRAVDDLRAGGQTVMLTGEPGVGKTRLAQEVTAEAHRRGFILGAGICYEQQQVVPYHPIREALEAVFAAVPAATRAEAKNKWPHLGRLVHDLGAPPPASGGGEEERAAIFWSAAGFVRAVSEMRPFVLAVDDLQWADDSSLDLLCHLSRQTRAYPVLILGTYRSDEIDRAHPLVTRLLELHRQQLLEQIAVKPLDLHDTLRLAAAEAGSQKLPSGLAELIHQRSEGNPFYIREMIRDHIERGSGQPHGQGVHTRGGQELRVPVTVRATMEQRLGRLDTATRDVVTDAAILGQVFVFDDLQALTGRREDELETALSAAEAVGLVQATGKDTYAFSHALVHQAIAETVTRRRSRRLHLAAAEMIESPHHQTSRSGAHEGREAELAWHFAQADEPDRAISYAVLAADRAAASFAYSEAERLYRTGLELAWNLGASPAEAPPSRKVLIAHTLEKLGGLLQMEARYPEALELLEQAARGYEEQNDVEGQRRVVACIGSVHAYQGSEEEGLARLEPLLTGPSSGKSSEGLALLFAARAHLLLSQGQYEYGLAAAEHASEEARRVSSESLVARVEIRHAEALSFLGRHEEARKVLEDAAPVVEQDDQASFFRALNGLARTQMLAGDLDQARRYHERALEIARRVGDRRGVALTLVSLSRVLFALGHWNRSHDLVSEALEMAEANRLPYLRSIVRILKAYLLISRGEQEEALHILGSELSSAQRERDGRKAALAQACLAELELLRGAPRQARERLEPLLERFEATSLDHMELLLPLLIRARLATDDVMGAEELTNRAAALATSSRNRVGFAEALWTRAMVRASEGRRLEAAHLFQAAATLARDMKYQPLEAHVLLQWGNMEAALGATGPAKAHLEEALRLFERSGLLAYVSIAEGALSALGKDH